MAIRAFLLTFLTLFTGTSCGSLHQDAKSQAQNHHEGVAGSILESQYQQSFQSIFHRQIEDAVQRREIGRQAYPFVLAQARPAPRGAALLSFSVEYPLLHLRKAFQHITADMLAQNQVFEPAIPRDVESELLRKAVENPPTIIVFPGIFGEFIKSRPFEAVFSDQNSHFARKYRAEVGKRQTEVFRLSEYGENRSGITTVPLSESLSLASLDDESSGARRPLLNLILLRPAFGSLETLGKLEDNTRVYLRRISDLLEILKAEDRDHLYFLGYSRGGPVALHVLAEANRQKLKWVESVRGFIGLGSVHYGSEVADDVLDPTSESLASSTFHDLLLLAENLDGNIFNNIKQWSRFALQTSHSSLQEVIEKERLGQRGGPLAREPLESSPIDFSAFLGLMRQAFLGSFRLDRAISQNADNVARFRLLAEKARDGIATLTTQNRLDWWKKNEIPKHTKIYTITGSMPAPADTAKTQTEPETPTNGLSLLLQNPNYGPQTFDFTAALRASFYTLHGMHEHKPGVRYGIPHNDSQVAFYAARFWPQLTATLNPNNVLQHHFLATMATHHWGLAFPIAFPTADHRVNPFPRRLMLRALGLYLAQAADH